MKIFVRLLMSLVALIAIGAAMLFWYPRPVDTTDPAVFAGDGAALDYCTLPVLDGSGLRAADIPKAFTPGCGYETFPMPILADCTEPLADGVNDIRGLWQSVTPGFSHVERIEQCGNRIVVTSAGIIHDIVTDGTLKNGARDVTPPGCTNMWAAVEWENDVLNFRPFGLPWVGVKRELRGEQLIWTYMAYGEITMERQCFMPKDI